MNKAYEAIPEIDAAITLTLEKEQDLPPVGADFDPVIDGVDDPGQANLAEIADRLDQLLEDDLEKDVSLIEVAHWLAEKELADLKVTGVEHVAPQAAYETSSSVSSGLGIDAWESEDGKYIFVDMPANIGNVKSLVNRSQLKNEEPVSEVKERSLIAELDEMREPNLGVVPDDESLARYGYVSIYNGEKGHAVCDKERIWRVLRKKKDGKCIYRIVIKKGARANRIAHGKHRKCVVYIDRLYRVDNPVI
jgi:hypothetical protein